MVVWGMRILFALLLVPVLLAPVRLKDSSPGFFMPPAQSPAPESYSLPAADPLVTPTVIPVSPTILPEAPTPTTVISPSLNLPSPPAAAPQPVIIQQVISGPPPMPLKMAALCQKGMILVQDLSLLTYQQKQSKSLMNMSIAAAAAAGEATSRQWPNLAGFNKAANSLPWFYPNKTEMQDAIMAARALCGN
ncbi:MAG: hypothetical protein DI585_00750 [Pseudomonas fluorescens]|nr:MAG: hypothetical protein DI585_00750 [Pseudomonas fluorescens]